MNKIAYVKIESLKTEPVILAVNTGSSSIKLSGFVCSEDRMHRLFDCQMKEIHSPSPQFEMQNIHGEKTIQFKKALNHQEAFLEIFSQLVIYQSTFDNLIGIGHRVVHGGFKYTSSVLIKQADLKVIQDLAELAPLHNEAAAIGFKMCSSYFRKDLSQVAVFDTAFHAKMPNVAANYALPLALIDKYHLKRYGFHGISNAFISNVYRNYMQDKFIASKAVTLHLGNGCSATAVKGGVSLDTSMGFTPAEGLVMGTRAGDIDAGAFEFLCHEEKKTPGEMMHLLNEASGLLGLSKCSSDMKTLVQQYPHNEHVQFAVDLFCYRIIKYVSAYLSTLEGLDALIFTGGIGENAAFIRDKIVNGLKWFGLSLDAIKNEKAISMPFGDIKEIHQVHSSAAVFVIATDENAYIAEQTYLKITR